MNEVISRETMKQRVERMQRALLDCDCSPSSQNLTALVAACIFEEARDYSRDPQAVNRRANEMVAVFGRQLNEEVEVLKKEYEELYNSTKEMVDEIEEIRKTIDRCTAPDRLREMQEHFKDAALIIPKFAQAIKLLEDICTDIEEL